MFADLQAAGANLDDEAQGPAQRRRLRGDFFIGEQGYIIKLGNARALFLSADETSNVVGNTAHILLEVDEAQDVSREKYSKELCS